jgi:(3S)-linalool synthase
MCMFILHVHIAEDDVLRRFIDGASGDFKLSLSNDVRGLLGLHDMSHLDVGGEEAALLHRAKEFSSSHLASAVRYLDDPSLAEYVRQSLDHPYHKARHHLRYLQSLPSSCRDAAVERLAVAEFQLNKSLHQGEMREIKRYL